MTTPGRKPKGCGTYGGYQRHIRNKETACEACVMARRAVAIVWRTEHREELAAKKRAEYHSDPDLRKRLSDTNRMYRAKNPQRQRSRALKKYGLTPDSFASMLIGQGNCCAICTSEKSGGRNWHVDHDHARGWNDVRGLLCTNCNAALGMVGDNLDAVRKWATNAIAYLIDHDLRVQIDTAPMPPPMPMGAPQ